MRWELKGMTFDQLWDIEKVEAQTGVETIEEGIVPHLYKVASEQYVIAIGDAPSAEELDRFSMGRLPMHEYLMFEAVWPLDEIYTIDLVKYFDNRREKFPDNPSFLMYIELAWNDTDRYLDLNWGRIRHFARGFESNDTQILSIYRVSGTQKIIAIVDFADSMAISRFVANEVFDGSKTDKVWTLRDYVGFADDVVKHYKV